MCLVPLSEFNWCVAAMEDEIEIRRRKWEEKKRKSHPKNIECDHLCKRKSVLALVCKFVREPERKG